MEIKTREIEEVRKNMIEKISKMSPEELEKTWNKGFGSYKDYVTLGKKQMFYPDKGEDVFFVEEQDWSDSRWDE